MALDDTPREAVRDGIPELDAHHFKRHLRYFATELVRLCARNEKDHPCPPYGEHHAYL
jgi:hypothetical protein